MTHTFHAMLILCQVAYATAHKIMSCGSSRPVHSNVMNFFTQ